MSEKSYLWGVNDKLLGITTNGKTKHFEYDTWGNLSKTVFEDGRTELRNPDKAGNLFESLDRLDRKYSQGGRLEKTQNWEYKYDKEGNLIRKKDKHGATWRYEWNDAGMLESVKRPDAREVFYKYDALGRRIEKNFDGSVSKWVWDGNVPLHEQQSSYWKQYSKEKGEYWDERKQPLVTWVFEEGTFVPVAKLTEKQKLSIATNYLGTPEAMYREDGEAVWTCELNSYGKVRNFQGQYVAECPFRFQGQYHDSETGLYYNRFRYYSPDEGMYISQDPIRLEGNNPTLYAYVHDTNSWVDLFGLFNVLHHTIPREIYNPRSSSTKPLLTGKLAEHPDIVGRAGNPNKWAIPDDVHSKIHEGARGGKYNDEWRKEITALRKAKGSPLDESDVGDILKKRDEITKKFGIDKYKPKCKG